MQCTCFSHPVMTCGWCNPHTELIKTLPVPDCSQVACDTILVLCLQVEAEAGHIAMALVQNKVDLLGQAAVRDDEAQEMAKRLRLRFYRACVKDNLNVAEGGALP